MMPTRLAVGLEPLNALDAAHRSPRSNSLSRAEFGSPVGSATRRSIKRNKELEKFLPGWVAVNQNREPLLDLVKRVPASAERLRSPNTPTNICVGQWSLPFFG
jgi:hypothetical protein